jgi:hypothetical protein
MIALPVHFQLKLKMHNKSERPSVEYLNAKHTPLYLYYVAAVLPFSND